MLVTMDQLKKGMALYLKNEVLPVLPSDSFAGFGAAFVGTLAVGYVDRFLLNLASNPLFAMFGIIDAEGRIELDAFADALKFAVPETGVTVPIGKTKITFRADDAAKLCDYIAK